MNRTELTRSAVALTERLARRRFSRHRDREELIADATSWAWEMAQSAGPKATAGSIAHYACRRTGCGRRRFRGGSRSVDHPRHRAAGEAVGFDVASYARPGDNPAVIVPVKLDLRAWLGTLSLLHRTIALLFALGYRTQEIAELVQRSEARISQVRAELRESWRVFQDG